METLYSNLFMNNLPIPSFFDHGHDNIFCRHEWQLLRNPTSDDFGINNKSLGDVLQCREDNVRRQKRFWESNTAIGAATTRYIYTFHNRLNHHLPVVQCPFEPLHTARH